jgi:GMP synthase-like glutamine amidotransferase
MKPVLILEHQIPENIAYLGTWLENHKIPYVVCNAERDGMFPKSMDNYSALAVMGGAMSANDPLPTNQEAINLISEAINSDIPVIGHCLGGQLMAKALGAEVRVNNLPEIGWQKIDYVKDKLVEDWFGSDPTQVVIHWHYDTFDIPSGAKLLASNKNCKNQAFSIGKHLAMQFHIEIDEKKLNFWTSDKDANWESAIIKYGSVQDKNEMLDGAITFLAKHKKTADNIYKYWLSSTELAEVIT